MGRTPSSRASLTVILSALLLAAPCCARKSAAWRDPSPHRVQFVTVDSNVRLEVLDWGGSGRPLVLLAGLGNTAHIFDEFAPKLTADYHVYGITRRGYGASSIPPSGYVADRLGDDVVVVLDSLKLSRPVLVGHSLGGEELSFVGSRYPDQVAGLIYLDAAYKYASDHSGLEKPSLPSLSASAKPVPPALDKADLANFQALRSWCIRFPGFAPPEAELRQEFDSGPNGGVGQSRTPPRVQQAIMAGMQKYSDIRVPALAIFAVPHDEGTWIYDDPDVRAKAEAVWISDTATSGAYADAFERGVPGARVVRLPHANHYVFMSNEADVLHETHRFVATLR